MDTIKVKITNKNTGELYEVRTVRIVGHNDKGHAIVAEDERVKIVLDYFGENAVVSPY